MPIAKYLIKTSAGNYYVLDTVARVHVTNPIDAEEIMQECMNIEARAQSGEIALNEHDVKLLDQSIRAMQGCIKKFKFVDYALNFERAARQLLPKDKIEEIERIVGSKDAYARRVQRSFEAAQRRGAP